MTKLGERKEEPVYKNLKQVGMTHTLALDPLLKQEHWASVEERKGVSMNSHLYKEQLLSPKRHKRGWRLAPDNNT